MIRRRARFPTRKKAKKTLSPELPQLAGRMPLKNVPLQLGHKDIFILAPLTPSA
jgi:hypothetical protein